MAVPGGATSGTTTVRSNCWRNRGYAVLQINYRQINYRGSAGYGKKYLHAGDHQWGLKDGGRSNRWHELGCRAGRRCRSEKGRHLRRLIWRLRIVGGSSVLSGHLSLRDRRIRPFESIHLFATMPPWWQTDVRNLFFTRVGDPAKSEDRAYLTKASPLFSANKIHIPMLIAQGSNDARVKPAESEQIITALANNHQRGTDVVYTDEGHGFARPRTRSTSRRMPNNSSPTTWEGDTSQ